MSKSQGFSTDRSSSECAITLSFKRYFINNLDSYQGEFILKEVSKILEKNIEQSKMTSETVIAEDAEPVTPPPPVQPYEIIGERLTSKNLTTLRHDK